MEDKINTLLNEQLAFVNAMLKIHKQQMKSEKWLLAFTGALIFLTAALLILAFFQAFPVISTQNPHTASPTYQRQEADKNCKNMNTEANPVKGIRGHSGADNISIPKH